MKPQIQNNGLSTRCELDLFNKLILKIVDGTNSVLNDDTSTTIPTNFILSLTLNDLQDMVKKIYPDNNSQLHEIILPKELYFQ